MKTAAMIRLSPLMLLMVAACAVPTTGVVPRGDGYFTVTRQGEGFWVTNDQLRTAALQEAGARCASASKPLKVIHVKDIPAGWGGGRRAKFFSDVSESRGGPGA
jgi:hypothetical protein